MRERFETKSKSNLLKEIEDILADASQSELSSIKESIVDRRTSMRTGKTQMEEPGSTQSTRSTVSTTMLKQNMDLDPLGKNLDSHGFSSNQSRPLINDDEEEAKLSSNQSIASSEKGGTRLSTPLSMTDQPSTLTNGDEEEAQLPSHQPNTLINGDEEEAQMPSHQSTKSSEKGEARLSPQQ